MIWEWKIAKTPQFASTPLVALFVDAKQVLLEMEFHVVVSNNTGWLSLWLKTSLLLQEV